MALNILDLDSAEQEADRKSAEMIDNFFKRFYRPTVDAQASLVLADAAGKIDPASAHGIRRAFGGKDYGNRNV